MRVAQNVIERDPEKAKRRDAQLIAMQAEIDKGNKPLIAFRVPGYAKGCVDQGHPAAGQPFVQGRVRCGGHQGLFDDVVGNGFVIVARNGHPAAMLSEPDLAFWSSLGGRFAVLGGRGRNGIEDLEGRYGAMMDEYGCDVLLARPDFYLFGACKSVAELPGLIGRLRERVGARGN
jgi:hypothetical protein